MKLNRVGTPLSRDERNSLNANWETIEAEAAGQKARVDNLVENTSQPSEVVDARVKVDGTTYPLLKDRLDDSDAQMENIAINVKKFGAVGDGVTDDTGALDNARAKGKPILLPDNGTFLYAGVINEYVPVTGTGKVVQIDGNPHPRFVHTLNTTHFLSSILSYLGLVNADYTDDEGTRFYILPKDKVISGAGGVIKVFGDAYHLGQDYRDMGIYFYQDQNNGITGGADIGSNETGVFWLNSKVEGTSYQDKHPDIGFSFQDGQYVAGRFAIVNGNPCFIIGPELGRYHGTNPSVGAELQKDAILYKDKYLRFEDNAGGIGNGFTYSSTDNKLKQTFAGKDIVKFNDKMFEFYGAVKSNYTSIPVNATTVDASSAGVLITNNTATTTITSLDNGQAGQRVTIIFNDINTTLQNNSTIKLKGGTNYHPTTLLSSIELMRLGSSWVEINRTDV